MKHVFTVLNNENQNNAWKIVFVSKKVPFRLLFFFDIMNFKKKTILCEFDAAPLEIINCPSHEIPGFLPSKQKTKPPYPFLHHLFSILGLGARLKLSFCDN